MRAKSRMLLSFATCGLLLQLGFAHAATVVALGASNTAGKGVSLSQAYPAQLETMLRARGFDVHVINAGVSGDTTGGMTARIESTVPKGTRVVIPAARRKRPQKGSTQLHGRASKSAECDGSQGYHAAKRNVSRQAAPARWNTPDSGRLPSARPATGRPGCRYAKTIAQTTSGWLLSVVRSQDGPDDVTRARHRAAL